MNRSEAISFLKEYELFLEINDILSKLVDYVPDSRERRGPLQDRVLALLDRGRTNELKKLISVVLRRQGIIPVKINGVHYYKNVRLKGL